MVQRNTITSVTVDNPIKGIKWIEQWDKYEKVDVIKFPRIGDKGNTKFGFFFMTLKFLN